MGNDTYHEAVEELSDETRDMHRAVASLMEEFEAVDWYNQRVDACKDEELRAILAHNRDEEKEHAAMVLEWIRRHDPRLEPAERRPERLALVEDRRPRQPGLERLQRKPLEELDVVVTRHAPLLVVVGDHARIRAGAGRARPPAALEPFGHPRKVTAPA